MEFSLRFSLTDVALAAVLLGYVLVGAKVEQNITPNLPESEINVLHSLYNSTNGMNWRWSNSTASVGGGIPWVFTDNCNPCTEHWQGVTCILSQAGDTYHVSGLDLDTHGLAGPLPDDLGGMPFMKTLSLQGNYLTGTIPSSLCNLTNLLFLSLSHNQLEGSIPAALQNVTSLRTVALSRNQLTGSLPDYFAKYSVLTNLDLSNNMLTGSIPTAYGFLMTLTYLNLGQNYLIGSIPGSFASLTALMTLALEINHLSGVLPDLSALNMLESIFCDHNQLSGSVPAYFGSMHSLEYVAMNRNTFSGTIPAALGGSFTLEAIALHSNLLSGQIPPQLGQSHSPLLLLDLHNNHLTGTIPGAFGNLSELTDLIVYGNRAIEGTIPPELGQISTLQLMDISNTALTGTLPSELCLLQQLFSLRLDSTYLSGPIPDNIGNMTALSYLSLHDNLHTATVPSSLMQLQYLGSLFIFNNMFTGNIPQFISSAKQPLLEIVQISGNRFTGQIPDDLFALPLLQVVILGENCFHGTLPTAMCNATRANTLSLDGLRSGTSCRDVIFPGSSDAAYVLTKHIHGGIPSCLFEMKRLNTLHLSGNGLTGPLPDTVNISVNLVDVSLSHNKLTGDIPKVFQERIWYNFDLSYNKFKGTLSDSFGTVLGNLTVMRRLGLQVTEDDQGVVQYSNPNGAVTLRNNRLSNTIPSVVRDMYNVSVLGGNLFGCDFDQNDLPNHDDGRYTYSCGSNAFDLSYFFYLSVLCATVALAVVVHVWRAELARYIDVHTSLLTIKKWFTIADWFNHDSEMGKSRLHRYKYVTLLFDEICKIAAWCTLYIIVVQMPLYSILSHYKGTHKFEYAWSVSAAFLSGTVAVACQLLFFCIMLAILLYLYKLLLEAMKSLLHNLSKGFDFSVVDTFQDEQDRKKSRYSSLSEKVLVYVVFFLVNVTVVGAANVGYVFAAIYAGASYQTLAQLSMSVFKLMWNNFGLIYLIRWTHQYLASSSTKDWRSNGAGFFAIQLFVQLFNYIVVPCVVVAAINPDCFNNAIVSAPAVTSYFYYEQCAAYSAVFNCLATYVNIASTSYNPPFTYSYECSSSLITFYSPTFVYLGFIVTFIRPLLNAMKRWVLEHTRRDTVWFACVKRTVPPILRPISASTMQSEQPYNALKPYFDANHILASISAFLGVLLTFGFVFPPLAPVMLISICSTVFVSRIEVGRFLTDAISNSAYKYTDIIDQECEGVGSIPKLIQNIRIIVIFSCLFYTLFLFDALGDEVGFQGAFWLFFVVPQLPLLIWYIHHIYYLSHLNRPRDSQREIETRASSSLKSTQDQELTATAEAPQPSPHPSPRVKDFELQTFSTPLSNRTVRQESESSDHEQWDSDESSAPTFSAMHKS